MNDFEREISKFIDIELIRKHGVVFNDIVEMEYKRIGFLPSDVFGKKVIDIGAHVGIFSLLCQALGARSIISIEANPKTFADLFRNLSQCPSVKAIINKAVFDGCIAEINIIDKDTGSTVTNSELGSFQGIQCISLDHILEEQNSNEIVMKMDIEGAEYTVLPACSKKSLRKCRTIFLETHPLDNEGNKVPGKRAEFIKEYLQLIGFKIVHQDYVWVNSFQNGICVSSTPIINFEF